MTAFEASGPPTRGEGGRAVSIPRPCTWNLLHPSPDKQGPAQPRRCLALRALFCPP